MIPDRLLEQVLQGVIDFGGEDTILDIDAFE
jgi:hypothetical protein